MVKELNLSERIHGADIRSTSQTYKINEDEIVDFSSNVNIYSSDIDYEQLINVVKANINKYPDIGYEKLRLSISKIYQVDKSYIIPGNGATELIYLTMRLPEILKIGIFQPTFCEYERAAKIAEKQVYNLTFDLLEEKNEQKLINIIENLDLLVICNPNNPTGEIKNIKRLAELSKKYNTILFIDETFIDFTDNQAISMLTNLGKYSNILILKAITKFYAMPGARLGYVFSSNEELITKMWAYKEPWSVNVMAQELLNQLEVKKITSLTHPYYKSEINRLTKIYNEIGIGVSNSVTNYLLLKLPLIIKGSILKEELLKKNKLLIRTCNDFLGLDDSFIRIAIKEKSQNTELSEAIKMIIYKGVR